MLGNSLLAAPLLQENQRIGACGFRKAAGTDYFSRKKYEGGRHIESDGEERFPVYLRAGHGLALKGPAREGLMPITEMEQEKCEDLHFLLAGGDRRREIFGMRNMRQGSGGIKQKWSWRARKACISHGSLSPDRVIQFFF